MGFSKNPVSVYMSTEGRPSL